MLDIGTGSGLLSMVAARMPVKGVVTCERDEAMANAAIQCIEANQLSEKVEVINKSSKDMVTQEEAAEAKESTEPDMKVRAEVLVAEIFGDDPLNEGVLGTLEHARENLLVPDALVVPCDIIVIASLCESETLTRFAQAPKDAGGSGLDFTDLSDLAKFRQYPRLKSYPHRSLTEPTEVCRITLCGEDFSVEGEDCLDVEVTSEGEVQFVVFWYELVFPGGAVYSTSAEEEMYGSEEHRPWSRAWNQVSYGLHHERGGLKQAKLGAKLRLKTEFRYDRLWFQVDNVQR